MAKARDGLRQKAYDKETCPYPVPGIGFRVYAKHADQIKAFTSTGVAFSVIRYTSFRNIYLLPGEVGLVQDDGARVLANEALTSLRVIVDDSTVEDRVLKIDRKFKHVKTESG